jgi:hypothetical protein
MIPSRVSPSGPSHLRGPNGRTRLACANYPHHFWRSTNAENALGLDLLPQNEMGIGILEERKENRLGTP